jgi:hypothetical protein
MIYWDDFRDKYGFDDGASVPPDAEAVRSVYVDVLNAIATRRRANCRAVEYDRSGLHNYCMILFRKVEPADAELGGPDDVMRAAIDELEGMSANGDLDGLVVTKVKLKRQALSYLCRGLLAGPITSVVCEA